MFGPFFIVRKEYPLNELGDVCDWYYTIISKQLSSSSPKQNISGCGQTAVNTFNGLETKIW